MMENNAESKIYKFSVDSLKNEERANEFKTILKNFGAIQQVDVNTEKRIARIVSAGELNLRKIKDALAPRGFHLQGIANDENNATNSKLRLKIAGTKCQSCEIIIEQAWKILPGIKNVKVDAARGCAELDLDGDGEVSVSELQKALSGTDYKVSCENQREGGVRAPYDLRDGARAAHTYAGGLAQSDGDTGRPPVARLIALFSAVFLIGYISSRFGLLTPTATIEAGLGLGTAFLIGLLAASSSCIAVSGGMLLSVCAKVDGNETRDPHWKHRFFPALVFVAGRVVSYGLFGGVIGIVGKALSPSPAVTGFITVVAAFWMLIVGLNMLHLSPEWLKKLLPKMPKFLAHKAYGVARNGNKGTVSAFMLGAATFFLPCGFTQSLQLYALTTGSFFTSAGLLIAFSLGTAPALLALGLASSSFKGKFGRLFFQFSGALVIVLGLWNIQNGFSVAGYPISLGTTVRAITSALTPNESAQTPTGTTDKNVIDENGTQVVRMKLTTSPPYYSPTNVFTVRAGEKVRMEILGVGTGCRTAFQIPKLGVRTFLEKQKNVLEFTPEKTGEYLFSCSMGMYRGTLKVI